MKELFEEAYNELQSEYDTDGIEDDEGVPLITLSAAIAIVETLEQKLLFKGIQESNQFTVENAHNSFGMVK